MFEHTKPQTLLKWSIVAALVYLLVPYDLLPDFLGLPGRIDDALVIAWLVWFYRNHVREFLARASRNDGAGGASTGDARGSAGGGAASDGRQASPPDPYAVLGVPRSASRDEIRAAYRARMREYHPDRVAHLGEELQKLAHEKSQEIQAAYRALHH